MIVLTGMSCSGKTAILKALCRFGYRKVVTFTTRPPRPKEKNGDDYWFISNKEFDSKIANGDFAETETFKTVAGTWRYGSELRAYGGFNRAIILTPAGIRHIRSTYPDIDIMVFYIEAPEFVRWKRMKDRGDNKQEVARRMMRDKEDFADIQELADYTIVNDGSLGIVKVAKKIASIHEETNQRR